MVKVMYVHLGRSRLLCVLKLIQFRGTSLRKRIQNYEYRISRDLVISPRAWASPRPLLEGPSLLPQGAGWLVLGNGEGPSQREDSQAGCLSGSTSEPQLTLSLRPWFRGRVGSHAKPGAQGLGGRRCYHKA